MTQRTLAGIDAHVIRNISNQRSILTDNGIICLFHLVHISHDFGSKRVGSDTIGSAIKIKLLINTIALGLFIVTHGI